MAKVTMTLTEALAKRTHLLKKLEECADTREYTTDPNYRMVFVKKNSESKIGSLEIDEATAQAQSTFDKLFSNINNFIALSKAINQANISNTVTIAGEEMTIAAAIVYKTNVVTKTKHQIIEIIKRQILNADTTIANYLAKRDSSDALNNYLTIALGSDTASRNPEEVKRQTELFYETNDAKVIDPLNLREKVNKIEEELTRFEIEVDTALSIANANITIEVEYVD